MLVNCSSLAYEIWMMIWNSELWFSLHKDKNRGWVEQKWSIIRKKTMLRREREKGQRERNKQMMMSRRLNHVPAVSWCFYDLHPELIGLINNTLRFDSIWSDRRWPARCIGLFSDIVHSASNPNKAVILMRDGQRHVFVSRASVCSEPKQIKL